MVGANDERAVAEGGSDACSLVRVAQGDDAPTPSSAGQSSTPGTCRTGAVHECVELRTRTVVQLGQRRMRLVQQGTEAVERRLARRHLGRERRDPPCLGKDVLHPRPDAKR